MYAAKSHSYVGPLVRIWYELNHDQRYREGLRMSPYKVKLVTESQTVTLGDEPVLPGWISIPDVASS